MHPSTKFEQSSTPRSETLIVTFCSMSGTYKDPPIFEFTNFLRKIAYHCDRLFLTDYTRSWYQYGVSDVSKNIEELVEYLKNFTKRYKNVVFMGISSGGYASILFGSLVEVNTVIALIPQTILTHSMCMKIYESSYTEDHKYNDLNEVINDKTKYVLVCAENIEGTEDLHGNGHCLRLKQKENVEINMIYWEGGILTRYRDQGFLKKLIFPHLNVPS